MSKAKSQTLARQYVIYVGKEPMNMANTLTYDHLQYRYPLMDIRSVPAALFLASDKPRSYEYYI